MHRNSLAAYDTLDLSERARAVLRVFVESLAPLTDREAKERGGYTDMNEVRPAITHMTKANPPWLEECGTVVDPETKKHVRLSRPTAYAMTMLKKPAPVVSLGLVTDAVRAECRQVGEYIAEQGIKGATHSEIAKQLPHIRPADINARIMRVAAFNAISVLAAEVRGDEEVWHITGRGLVTLGKEPANHWHVDQPNHAASAAQQAATAAKE